MPRPLDVSPEELHWVAGLLEAGGSFFPGPPHEPEAPVVQVRLADEDVVRGLEAVVGGEVTQCSPARERWAATWQLRLVGEPAVVWMAALRPLLGSRRRGQVDQAVADYEMAVARASTTRSMRTSPA